MSSATNEKRDSLEREFQRRMQDAEASPSADLWARIDHSLTVQESGQYKRSMLFYRQLAAACITLLLVAGGFAAYYYSGPLTAPLAQVQQRGAMAPTGQAAEEEGLTSDEAIAASMQKAVRPQEPEGQSLAQASEAIAEPALKQHAEVSDRQLMAAHENSPGPGAWHNVPADEHASVLRRRQEERESNMAAGNLLPNPQHMRQAYTSQPAAGFAATGTPSVTSAPDDFRRLNEMVMSRVKELQAEQEAVQQMYKADKALTTSGKTERERDPSGKWSLAMAYAPSYFEQNIGIPSQMMMGTMDNSLGFAPPSVMQRSTALVADAREEYEEEVEPGFSFGVEVKSGFKLGKKWKLLAGLGFTQNTARSKSSYVIQQFWRKPESGQPVSPGPTTIFLPSLSSNFASDSLSIAKTDEFDVQYRYRHLTVPAGVQYEGKLGKDWFWFAGGGVAANILVQTSVLASSSDVRDKDYTLSDDDSPFRKLQWSGNVTAGVGKRLTDNMSVAIGPEYRSYFDTMLSSPEKARAPQGKPYTMGINMALNYDLGSGRR